MKIYPVKSIVVKANRQRQEFDPVALEELRSSILDNQLMQAIVVRETVDGPTLVAGERRLKAIQTLWALGGVLRYNNEEIAEGYVPTVTLGELSELAAEDAELNENLKRKDLTWQEMADAVSRLHLLRNKQLEAKKEAMIQDMDYGVGMLPDKWAVADTAQEVRGSSEGWNQDIVRQQIIVAKHLDNPEVAGAKSVSDAFKILKKQEQAKKNTANALAVAQNFSVKDHTLLRGDCIVQMAQMIANGRAFDVILTDPPYGMGAHEFGDGGGKLGGIEHHYDDSYKSWQTLMLAWTALSYQIAKPKAHAYVFCDFDRFHELKGLMQGVGWYVFRTPLVVYKTNSGRVPLPDRGPRRQYELILYAIKGDKLVTHIYPDVITSERDEQLGGHGAQKPVDLFVNLLQRSVRAGDEVLDSFAGSGTIFPACHRMHVKATGIEAVPEYQGQCLARLEELEIDQLLPGIAG